MGKKNLLNLFIVFLCSVVFAGTVYAFPESGNFEIAAVNQAISISGAVTDEAGIPRYWR